MIIQFVKRAAALLCCLGSMGYGYCCTSAIVGAKASASGRPLLWKHRDTSHTDNVVEYIPAKEGEHSYVALFNAKDTLREEAWIGFNDVGFAVMNTASYNIKDDNVPQSKMDREGFLMTVALRSCTSVDDFERLLVSLPRPMGVEANFGVIDVFGNGAFFETNNDSFIRFDLEDAPGGVLIRTNYSHSGRPGEGYGYIREANAEHLLKPFIDSASVTPELLTENISRNFYHDVSGKDALSSTERWIVDEDFIPRYKSTATVVIEGMTPPPPGVFPSSESIIEQYVMWTGLGYPPCAEIMPVWCHPEGVAQDLRGTGPGGTAPLGNLAKERRDSVFSYPQGRGKKKGKNTRYLDSRALINDQHSGYIQILVPENMKIYERIKSRRDNGEIHFNR